MSSASKPPFIDEDEQALLLDNPRQAASFLKTMANEHRLMILCQLSKGEMSVGELNQKIPLAQSALSQHLALLRREGVVTTRRNAQSIYYSLAGTDAMDTLGLLAKLFAESERD